MFLTLRGSAGLRGRGQNGHPAVHCRVQHLVLPEILHQDILMEYFREHEMLDAAVDGRMTILPSTAQTG